MKSFLFIKTSLITVVPILLLTVGCQKQFFKDPDVSSVRKVLNATMPLAYAANLTNAVLNGENIPNVKLTKNGDSTMGGFLAEITVDNNFPMPQGVGATGVILVAGISARQNVLMMTVAFTKLKITQGQFTINDISTIPVINDSDLVTGKKTLFVVFADEDINAGSDTLMDVNMSKGQVDAEFKRYENMKNFDGIAIVEQNCFIIQIDNKKTPSDPFDDTYSVSGAGQYVEAGSSSADIEQLIMVGCKMTPSCKFNPIDGWAMIQNTSSSENSAELDHVVINGQDNCDGTMFCRIATGLYVRSMGKSIRLGL